MGVPQSMIPLLQAVAAVNVFLAARGRGEGRVVTVGGTHLLSAVRVTWQELPLLCEGLVPALPFGVASHTTAAAMPSLWGQWGDFPAPLAMRDHVAPAALLSPTVLLAQLAVHTLFGL